MQRVDPRLQVYVLTSHELVPGRGHLDVARAAIEGGATAIQLRAPELDDERLLPLARSLVAMCRSAGVVSIVNDRLPVALASEADGIHLGQDDRPEKARALLGPEPILGVSVSTSAQAVAAEELGASYLGVVVWATGTKPGAKPVGLGGLRKVATATKIPIVGVGGIDPTNAGEVLDAGAAGVATVSSVGAAYDPVAATRSLRRVVDARVKTAGARGRLAP